MALEQPSVARPGLGRRIVWLVLCLAAGALVGATGHALSGDARWYLAMAATFAAGFAVADGDFLAMMCSCVGKARGLQSDSHSRPRVKVAACVRLPHSRVLGFPFSRDRAGRVMERFALWVEFDAHREMPHFKTYLATIEPIVVAKKATRMSVAQRGKP